MHQAVSTCQSRAEQAVELGRTCVNADQAPGRPHQPRHRGPQSGASPSPSLLPCESDLETTARECFSTPVLPDRRIDDSKARQTYETILRDHNNERVTSAQKRRSDPNHLGHESETV